MNLWSWRATGPWEVAENAKNSERLEEIPFEGDISNYLFWKNSEILDFLLEQLILLHPSTKIQGFIHDSY